MNKRAISLLLTLCMIVTLFSGMTLSAGAVEAENEETTAVETVLPEGDHQAAEETEAAPEAEPAEEAAPVEEATEEAAAPAEEAEASEEAESAEETEPAEEETPEVDNWDFKAVFKSDLIVAANDKAGLGGDVLVDFVLGGAGKIYLPGKAVVEDLAISWADPDLTLTKDDVTYESGEAPLAPAGESVTYKVQKGNVIRLITLKTVQGSGDVEAMFLNIDESLGTIKAMNKDDEHETSCYGSVNYAGVDYPYFSMKGRGNSTWVFDKKPYNITFYKKADYDSKKKVELIDGVKSKKWSLLANYLDNSLLRNKVGLDLAENLGIGLDSAFVDVWMNGEFLGNYLLTPKKDYNAPDEGYMLENDHIPEDIPEQFEFPNIKEMPLKHNVVNVEDIGDDAVDAGETVETIQAWFTEAWNAVLDWDSEDYQKYFDLDSWAKMYLMFEVSKTYDCYSGNIIMHRDGLTENDKLIAGPAWDYDIAFGRTLHKFFVGVTEHKQLNAEGWYNDSVGMVASKEPYSILQGLGMHESFLQRVTEVYNDYKWAFEDLAADTDRQAELICDSAMMNNELWGTHSLSADYLVAPNTMSLLGTGSYQLRYEITLTWQNYVNNLKEFCTKRVMWMSDHMYAEYPAGSIAQAVNGEDIVLRAALTAGNGENSYQWQISADGKTWTNLDGETAATLRVPNTEESAGMLVRCVVKNAGVDIYTTHGGWTKASAQTILDPVPVDVETKEVEESKELQDGDLIVVLRGKELGAYTFTETDGGWTIQSADGQYAKADGRKVVYTDEPFVWSYEDGVFSAETKVTYTFFGRRLGLGFNRTVYLTRDGAALTVSLNSGDQATFLKRGVVQ